MVNLLEQIDTEMTESYCYQLFNAIDIDLKSIPNKIKLIRYLKKLGDLKNEIKDLQGGDWQIIRKLLVCKREQIKTFLKEA
jgi:hypothetical protein